jgi:hypothetical protein
MAATKVGMTNGSINKRNQIARPQNSQRANTHAMGTPTAAHTAVVTKA